MALLDVKDYYVKMLNQYIETKDDLADFEDALKNGYITEDKLEDVKNDVLRLKENLDRVSFILYLFELPKRSNKKKKFEANETNKLLIEYFKNNNATKECIEAENVDVLTHLRKELKKFKKE